MKIVDKYIKYVKVIYIVACQQGGVSDEPGEPGTPQYVLTPSYRESLPKKLHLCSNAAY